MEPQPAERGKGKRRVPAQQHSSAGASRPERRAEEGESTGAGAGETEVERPSQGGDKEEEEDRVLQEGQKSEEGGDAGGSVVASSSSTSLQNPGQEDAGGSVVAPSSSTSLQNPGQEDAGNSVVASSSSTSLQNPGQGNAGGSVVASSSSTSLQNPGQGAAGRGVGGDRLEAFSSVEAMASSLQEVFARSALPQVHIRQHGTNQGVIAGISTDTFNQENHLQVFISENNIIKDIYTRTKHNLEDNCPQGFVETRAYRCAKSHLDNKDQGTCLVTGRSGDGKSTLACQVLRALEREGCVPLKLTRPDQCNYIPWNKVGERVKIVLMMDDVMGRSDLDKKLLAEWERELKEMKPFISRGQLKVILTSRVHMVEEVRVEADSEQVLLAAPEMALASQKMQLSQIEMSQILSKALKLKNVELPQDVWELAAVAWKCGSIGFPQCCQFLADQKAAQADPVGFFQNPVLFLKKVFEEMKKNEKKHFFVLTLVLCQEGRLTEDFLRGKDSKGVWMKVAESVGVSQNVGSEEIRQIAESMKGTFLHEDRKSEVYSFCHQSVGDVLFVFLCEKDLEMAVKVCSCKQAVEYIRPEGCGESGFYYRLCSRDLPVFARRLMEWMTCGECVTACSHPCLQDKSFAQVFIEQCLSEEGISTLLSVCVDRKSVKCDKYLIPAAKWKTADFSLQGAMNEWSIGKPFGKKMEVDIVEMSSCMSHLALNKCTDVVKHMIGSKAFAALPADCRSQLLTELLGCALYLSECSLAELLSARGAQPSVESVRAACCSQEEDVELVRKALEWQHLLSVELLQELARLAGQKGRAATLRLIVACLSGYAGSRAELDAILAELCLLTHGARLIHGGWFEKISLEIPHLSEVLQVLIEAGASFRTHMNMFLAAGHFDCRVFSEVSGKTCDLTVADKDGYTSLHWAALCGAEGNVGHLLSLVADASALKVVVNRTSGRGDSVLVCGSMGGSAKIVESLIGAGAEVNLRNSEGESPLYMAARGGHHTVVKLLIQARADVNLCDKSGHTPLFAAALRGHHSVVQVLLSSGADVNLCDKSGHSPLLAAARGGHHSVMQVLLSSGADVKECDKSGQSPLIAAAFQGHHNVVQVLLSSGADVNMCDKFGHSPLLAAALGGYHSVVQVLLSSGADVNVCDKKGLSPLLAAVLYGHHSVVQVLLSSGADVNLCDKSGQSPLTTAIVFGHHSVVQVLLSSGADVNLCDKSGLSPLTAAAVYGQHSVMQVLLSSGADVNVCGKSGLSPLTAAAVFGHHSVVQALLSSGADVNLCDKSGLSPLTAAALLGHHSVMQVLLSSGADVNLCNKSGLSPLTAAALGGYHSVVQVLLSSGADVNLCDNGGQSPLTAAALRGHHSVVQVLLSSGADVNLCNKKGQSPLTTAALLGHHSVVQALLSSGADVNLCDKSGLSPLTAAAFRGHHSVVQVLLSSGADVNLCHKSGRTPLDVAAREGHHSVVELLTRAGAHRGKQSDSH